MLLAAQLEAALRDYGDQVCKFIPSIEGLASAALALLALSDVVTELSDGGDGLRDLKRKMDAAVQLVAEIQAVDGAARYLAGRLTRESEAIDGADANRPASGVHPLDQKAYDFLDRIRYMEAAADDCVVILERLKEAADALVADAPATGQISDVSPESQTCSQQGVAAAAEKIKAILDKAEDDIAVHAGKNTDILQLLDRTGSPALLCEPHDELEVGGYTGLNFTFPATAPDDEAFRSKLSVFLSKMDSLYTMGQERDIHRAFAKACGLEIVEEIDVMEDGLF